MHIDEALLERMAQKRLVRLSNILRETFREQYPKECRILGDTQLKIFCDKCVNKAYGYGATDYGELKAYALLAWILGIGFDDDPLYPWVKEILEKEVPFESKTEEITEMVNALYYFTTQEQLQNYKEALERLLKLNFATIKQFTSYADIVKTLQTIYPQRVKVLGGAEQVKEALKYACHGKTIRYNIDHPIGIFVYATLVFFLGHRVDDDPLYSWAKKYLNSDEPQMAHKLDRLIKVIEKRVRNLIREIEKSTKESA